jgi:flagellar basal body-associated protein FliL
MEDVDLDYNVNEIEADQEGDGSYPKWLLWVFRIVSVVIFILIGIGLTVLVLNIAKNIRAINYEPEDTVLGGPREPLTIYEINREFEINLIEGNKAVKVIIPAISLAYDQGNTALSQVMNSKGSNIERRVRETISKQSISDLSDSQTRETVVKNAILWDINKYLVGVEHPVEGSRTGEVITAGTEVRLRNVVYDNPENGLSKPYAKVIDLEEGIEGWVPLQNISQTDVMTIITEDSQVLNGRKVGGVEGLDRGIVDIYFTKGIRILPIRNRQT